MPPLKIPRGRRDVTGRSPPVATRSFSNEAAERDPAWAFAPPHTGQTVTAQHHPPQGSSRATGTHSHWQGGTSSCSRHPQGTPGTLTSASNQIKLLQRSCLTSGQPCIALAQKFGSLWQKMPAAHWFPQKPQPPPLGRDGAVAPTQSKAALLASTSSHKKHSSAPDMCTQ